MRVLIDACVILDVFMKGRPKQFVDEGAKILEWALQHPKRGCLAAHTLTNIHYMLSSTKTGTRDQVRSVLQGLTGFLYVASVVDEDVSLAFQEPLSLFNDFEDAMQVLAASSCRSHAIVTRNLKDYKHSPITVLTPTQFIELYVS